MNDELVREKALEHARSMGCNCEPDIDYTMSDDGEVMQLTIAHDDDCRLMHSTSDN